MFASSIQENQENEYGRSKIDGQNIIKEWAKEHNTGFLTMVFPNLFGPLAKPFSHSFIATFCYKLTHNETPEVIVDNEIQLKYIDNLVEEILPLIDNVSKKEILPSKLFVPDYVAKVTTVLFILKSLKENYLDKDISYPKQKNLESNLYDTITSYIKYII